MAQIDYPAHLEMMWQRAIASREPDAPTVISTFAGGGGSLTGYLMAGYRDLLAIEWDDNAVETLRLNWPDLDIYHGDIKNISVDEVLERAGLEVGELDVLDGSPPCQGFSTAGKRIMSDSRNMLFREYIRLLRGLRPKVLIMENVSGMVKGKMKLIFVEILKELKASGYQVKAAKLNAMYFHVPQSRERIIFIGVRNDLGIEPGFPVKESEMIGVMKALRNVPDDETAFIVGEHTKIYQDMKRVIPGDSQPGHHSHIRLPINKPSPAILADAGFGHYHYWHPIEHRVLTFIEFQRIQSFGDCYKVIGSPGDRWKQLGNSVPPLMIEAIARHVRNQVLDCLTAELMDTI